MSRESRLAVVSGGGTGIGKALARRLAQDGDQVVIIGRCAEVLRSAAEEINDDVGVERVSWHSADLTRCDDVASVVQAITGDSAEVDVVANLVGRRIGDMRGDEPLEEIATNWQENFTTNVMPTVLLTHALLPHLKRPGGRILGTSASGAFYGRGAYGAAKAALHTWAYSMVNKLSKDGITINIVAPGLAPHGERLSEVSDEARKKMALDRIPAGRFGTPEEIASAAHYLVSAEASFITGQIIQVNGWMVLGRG